MEPSALTQLLVSGLTTGMIYALLALGLNVLANSTDVINVSHGEFFVLGGTVAILLRDSGLPIAIAGMGSVLTVGVVAGIIGRLTIIPMLRKGAASLTVVIVTIGIGIVLSQAIGLIWGRHPLYLQPFSSGDPIQFAGAYISHQVIWVIAGTTLVMGLLQLFFTRTDIGMQMIGVSVNRTAAHLVGINVGRVVLYSVVLSGILGGLAGVLITPISATSYLAGLVMLLKGFTAATIGGLGHPVGAVIGGILLGVVESLSTSLISSGWRDFIAFAILLLVLGVRPQGIFGTRLM